MSYSRSLSCALGLLAAVLVTAPPAAAQQSSTVRGSVTDSASQRGIPGVSVSVPGSTRGSMTDDAGRFTLRNVPVGSTTIRAQRIGYGSQDRTIIVKPAKRRRSTSRSAP